LKTLQKSLNFFDCVGTLCSCCCDISRHHDNVYYIMSRYHKNYFPLSSITFLPSYHMYLLLIHRLFVHAFWFTSQSWLCLTGGLGDVIFWGDGWSTVADLRWWLLCNVESAMLQSIRGQDDITATFDCANRLLKQRCASCLRLNLSRFKLLVGGPCRFQNVSHYISTSIHVNTNIVMSLYFNTNQ